MEALGVADKGSVLTSVVIFYLCIGAAIFQLLEEPNWQAAVEEYNQQKTILLKKFQCLTQKDLDSIIEVVAKAAGQGVTITGDKHFENWTWHNALVFAATILTTIGYGNVSPKTVGGRVFCILFGLSGIPLCFTWISELGTFFGSRAKRLSRVLIHKGLSVKKVQLVCTTVFLLWGLLFHLLIPPFIFMAVEEWTYMEGLYFCFITLTTIGFGDYVAGVNTNIHYAAMYRFCVEMWIYMGLAWLSLFFSWNVHMVVEAHKVLKKRRQMRHKFSPYDFYKENNKALPHVGSIVDIFKFMSEKGEDYSDVIRAIGKAEKMKKQQEDLPRSKSCSDLLKDIVIPLEQSPKQKRRFSIGDNVYMVISRARGSVGDEEERWSLQEPIGETEMEPKNKEAFEKRRHCSLKSTASYTPLFQGPRIMLNSQESLTHQNESRFSVIKLEEADLLEKGNGPGGSGFRMF